MNLNQAPAVNIARSCRPHARAPCDGAASYKLPRQLVRSLGMARPGTAQIYGAASPLCKNVPARVPRTHLARLLGVNFASPMEKSQSINLAFGEIGQSINLAVTPIPCRCRVVKQRSSTQRTCVCTCTRLLYTRLSTLVFTDRHSSPLRKIIRPCRLPLCRASTCRKCRLPSG
jgi:hypothetical protein